jgi:K+-transporting ATPase ATPase A chain
LLQLIQVGDLALLLAVVLLSAWLLAPWIVNIYKRTPSRIDRILNPIENAIYRICGVDPSRGMGWKEYLLAALLLNIVQMAIAFVILVNQNVLPLNPRNFPGLSWHLALNTVVSFATNTNLQHYNGETTLSYFSQMSAIQFLQFTSAATGICCGVAMVRGLVVHSKDMGNFYVDFVRSLTRLFIPLCFISSIVFIALGVPQTIGG